MNTKNRKRVVTVADLLTGPPAVSLATAANALDLGIDKARNMVQNGTFPVRVLRMGRTYRVPTSELLKLVGIDPTATPHTHDTPDVPSADVA